MNPVTPLTAGAKLRLSFTRKWRTSGFWFGLAITLLWPFTMFGTRVGWRGGEHLPRTGGALLAANHVSLADPIFQVAFCICHGRMPRFLAKAELWQIPVVRSVLGKGGHIPVYRESARAGDAYRDAIAAIQRGEIVVFYPEATYTADPDGWPMKAKNGVGADRAGHRRAGDPDRELGHPARGAARASCPGCSRGSGSRWWRARPSTSRDGRAGRAHAPR